MFYETYTRSSCGEEYQASQVGSTLVGHSAGGIDERGDSVGVNGRTNDGRAPAGNSGGSLPGLDELFLAVSCLVSVVCVAEEGAEDSEGGDLVIDDAEGDGRRLDTG
jgi:hypothetical protein